MSEPRRFSEGGGSELERLVVSSVHDEAPSPQVRRRAGAALGLGAGLTVTTATTSALGASKGATAGATLGLTKWIAVAAVTGLTAAGAAVVLQATPPAQATRMATPTTTAAQAPAARMSGTPRASVPPSPATPSGTESALPLEEPVVAPSAVGPGHASAAAPRPTVSLGDELRVLDDARAALAAGDSGRALGLLDRHDRDFAPAALAPEAMALRVEAVARSGDRAGATRLASRFLSLYGDRPEAQHVRSILEAQEALTNP